MKTLAAISLLLISLASYGQIKVTPYLSAGVASHLKLNGLNYEIGIENELFKRVDISIYYRHLNAQGEVFVSALSGNISFVAVNRNNHRLMLGPGISYGRYIRSTHSELYDKNYS